MLHVGWFQFQDEIELQVKARNQQINELQAKNQLLYDYLEWMAGVDEGKSVKKDVPKDLDNFEMPKWEEIRSDAVAQLPGYGNVFTSCYR